MAWYCPALGKFPIRFNFNALRVFLQCIKWTLEQASYCEQHHTIVACELHLEAFTLLCCSYVTCHGETEMPVAFTVRLGVR